MKAQLRDGLHGEVVLRLLQDLHLGFSPSKKEGSAGW